MFVLYLPQPCIVELMMEVFKISRIYIDTIRDRSPIKKHLIRSSMKSQKIPDTIGCGGGCGANKRTITRQPQKYYLADSYTYNWDVHIHRWPNKCMHITREQSP